MTAPVIYFGGGEDSEHMFIGAGTSVITTSGSFRSLYARCSLSTTQAVGNGYWQSVFQYIGTPSTFWFSGRIAMGNFSGSNGGMLSFIDSTNHTRLQIVCSGGLPVVQKVNTAGTATTLTNTLGTWGGSFSGATGGTDKIDVSWVNSGSGSINIYINGIKQFNYTGDTTTETTAIAGHRLGNASSSSGNWSEIIVSDTDTRTWNLQTAAPVANGNTHNFDTGTPAASNVNEITANYATLDGSTTAGQIDQYTIPAIAAGTYTIVAVGVSSQLVRGASGPQHMDLGVRSGSTDYWSSDQALTLAWANYQNWWNTDPNTSATWTALPANIGLKSVT